MKNKLKSLLICSSVFFVGCQTSSTLKSSANLTGNQLLQSQQAAKAELQASIKQQMFSSFSYQTDVSVSNAKRLTALANATDEQLNNLDDKSGYCNHTHDMAYVALLKQAEQAGLSIEDDVYAANRAGIKQSYLNCTDEYDEWSYNYYSSYDDEQPEYLPEYDDNHTKADVKKAQLLDAYLLDTSAVKITGEYQPLAGKFSLLPVASYTGRNVSMSYNQPMYLDIKAGELYFWADNFASLVATGFDERLGTAWKNKWLRLSLNDGSLPQGISKDLILTVKDAMQTAYSEEPIEGFAYLNANEFLNKSSHLNDEQRAKVKADYVISRQHPKEIDAKQRYLFNKAFYDGIMDKYPSLFDEQPKADDEEINSRMVLMAMFDTINSQIEDYEEQLENHDKPESQNTIQLMQYYGYNRRGKMDWWYYNRHFLGEDNTTNEGMMLDAITTFNSTKNDPFTGFTGNIQLPNTQNTVDIKTYIEDLLEHYENDGGTGIGKLLYGIKETSDNYTINVIESEE